MSADTITPETIAENRRRWVAALRSGKYEQGTSFLRRVDGGYCCLGVGADVLDPFDWERPIGGSGYKHRRYGNSRPFLGDAALALLGLSYADQADLASANDHGAAFATIADMIEALPIRSAS